MARMPPTSLQPAWVQATVPGDSWWWGVDPAMTSVERSLLWGNGQRGEEGPRLLPPGAAGTAEWMREALRLRREGLPAGCGP